MKAFFRVDDVGDWLVDRDRLSHLTDCLLRNKIPACLQVIPKSLDGRSSALLEQIAEGCPGMVEIGQHGWSHDLREFDGSRSMDCQANDISRGAEILRNLTGKSPMVFTPPEHVFTSETVYALDNLGFCVLSKQVKPTVDGNIFYWVGRMLGKQFLFGKKVSYHGKQYAGTRLSEISISIELTKLGQIKPIDLLKSEYVQSVRAGVDPIGFLIHHEHIKTSEDRMRFEAIADYFGKLPNLAFHTIEELYGFISS